MKVIVIGGGIIGLSSAYFLQQSGHEVTVIDQTDMLNNCSYGNAGYVCPSHFIPLATPGIVKQGLRWMLNDTSPFYVQPRFSKSLIDWGIQFMRSATPEKVEKAAIPLRDIALFSQHMYATLAAQPNFNFAYEHKGLLEIFQTEKGAEHAKHTVEKAHRLGLMDTVLLDYHALQTMEPQTKINALGAIYFKCDAHLYPNKLMAQLLQYLQANGVALLKNETVANFYTENHQIKSVVTAKAIHSADAFVLATGSWSRELAAQLRVSIPLMPGRGYSVTLENTPYHINYPAILVEGRAALTPMDGNKIRFGGTMEITKTTTPPKIKRVAGLLQAVQRFYPEFTIPMPSIEQIWYGFRPCSADGLPYIGKPKQWHNLVMATGHSMLGLSLGAGTGKLVTEILNEQKTSLAMDAFRVNRFD
ncbi:FAD-dependent oxidoreductase [Hydrotalea sp.]|uniref:NAD(P)/FAD-dependent oxidoreductase n=1 Tax=Hydrotalea sp. TaxID=2881279 RepID=UPI00261D6F5F|nr:FAD-dependent oxidoreductase [Hydrotalea sp.]